MEKLFRGFVGRRSGRSTAAEQLLQPLGRGAVDLQLPYDRDDAGPEQLPGIGDRVRRLHPGVA